MKVKLSWASPALLRKPILLISLLIVSACVLVASTYRHFGVTWDEPEDLGLPSRVRVHQLERARIDGRQPA